MLLRSINLFAFCIFSSFHHFKCCYSNIANVAIAGPAEKQEDGNKEYKFELMDNDIVRTERSQIPPPYQWPFVRHSVAG